MCITFKILCFQFKAAILIGALGGISNGGVLGFSAIFFPYIQTAITTEEKSWIGKHSSSSVSYLLETNLDR